MSLRASSPFLSMYVASMSALQARHSATWSGVSALDRHAFAGRKRTDIGLEPRDPLAALALCNTRGLCQYGLVPCGQRSPGLLVDDKEHLHRRMCGESDDIRRLPQALGLDRGKGEHGHVDCPVPDARLVSLGRERDRNAAAVRDEPARGFARHSRRVCPAAASRPRHPTPWEKNALTLLDCRPQHPQAHLAQDAIVDQRS